MGTSPAREVLSEKRYRDEEGPGSRHSLRLHTFTIPQVFVTARVN